MHLPAHCCARRSGEENLEASRLQAESARATRQFFAERARASVDFVDGVFHLLTDP